MGNASGISGDLRRRHTRVPGRDLAGSGNSVSPRATLDLRVRARRLGHASVAQCELRDANERRLLPGHDRRPGPGNDRRVVSKLQTTAALSHALVDADPVRRLGHYSHRRKSRQRLGDYERLDAAVAALTLNRWA